MHLQSIIVVTKAQKDTDVVRTHLYMQLSLSTRKEFELHIDVPEKKKSIGVEEVASIQDWNAKKTDVVKIAYIWNAQTLTTQAQNALLKVLEEPGNNTLIVLITDDKDVLLETIQSRCRIARLDTQGELNNGVAILHSFFAASYLDQKQQIFDIADDKAQVQLFLEALVEHISENRSIQYSSNTMIEWVEYWQKCLKANVSPKLLAQSILLHIGSYE